MMNGEKSETRNGHPEGCRCPMCMWGHSDMRHRKHMLVKVLVLILVFAFGVCVGAHHESHHRFHDYYGREGMMDGGYGRMMGGGWDDVSYQVYDGNAAVTYPALPSQGVRLQIQASSTKVQ